MENTGGLTPTIPENLTVISIDTFKTRQVHNPLPYRDEEPINRSNFASWIIRGFSFSRGDPAVQYAYVRWSAAHTGLDFQATLNNFIKAGEEKCLSEEEKQLLEIAYSRVRQHRVEDARIRATDNPAVRMLVYYASEFVQDAYEYYDDLLEDFPSLEALDNLPKAEFMKWGDVRYERTLTERAELEKKRQKKREKATG